VSLIVASFQVRAWTGGIILRSARPAPGLGSDEPGRRAAGLEEANVPSLVAGLVASLAGWVIDDLFQPHLGTGATLILSLLCSTVVFFAGRKWLIELRGR
jgi:hypothetical protein